MQKRKCPVCIGRGRVGLFIPICPKCHGTGFIEISGNGGGASDFKMDEEKLMKKICDMGKKLSRLNQKVQSQDKELKRKNHEIGLLNAEIIRLKQENKRLSKQLEEEAKKNVN